MAYQDVGGQEEVGYLDRIRRFCEDRVAPGVSRIERDGGFFPDLIRDMAGLGLVSLMFGEENRLEPSRMPLLHETTELLASYHAAPAVALGGLRLQAYLLSRYSLPEVTARWLPPLLDGRLYGAFAVTEPEAGTDVRAIRTVLRRQGEGWVLSGSKAWIGFAPVASFALVLAKLETDSRDADTRAVLVELDRRGVSRGPVEPLMSFRGMPVGRLDFDEVHVPEVNTLRVDGFAGMMEGINLARTEAASLACGLIRACLRHCSRRARERRVFGKSLAHLQAIQTKAGRMSTDYEAARLLALEAGRSFAVERGGDAHLISKAKLFATDAAVRHGGEAVQIFGASGVHLDSAVQRIYRDGKATQIYDGTSEIHLLMIGRHALAAAHF